MSSTSATISTMAETRQLLLLRHAKSSWDDPTLDDHDRPLAPRGRRAAKLIGEHLRRERAAVGLILCSSARRARETLELIDVQGDFRIEPELYGASAGQLLERVHQATPDVASLMLIGHNPAIEELARQLAAGAGPLEDGKFPTGALATLTFTGPWSALSPGQAQLTGFVKPRELG